MNFVLVKNYPYPVHNLHLECLILKISNIQVSSSSATRQGSSLFIFSLFPFVFLYIHSISRKIRLSAHKGCVSFIKTGVTFQVFTHNTSCSEVFTVGGRAWKFALYRGRKDGKYLAIYLEVADVWSLPQGWSIYAAFTFTVVNQASPENSEKGDLNHKFRANVADWGYPSFMELAKLQNPSNGYILNDKCIVEVEFSEDLGKVEKSFVPLLVEVCSWHPSLLDCKKNKSRRFTEWAFTALGQVLRFLKNKKWKDMNEKACEELQQLWEELEMSRLDLSWLEPLVKSAVNMKGYYEKVDKVKNMKQNLVMLETKMNMIKEKLVVTEESIEMMRKELVNAVEDFEEKDLEAEIGYGKPE
ncbi:hypothetical protein K1719_017806 [Acacia pycnantha]|nr:hypothetical protein K1719_017806 [Acacia pycnantha]